jgi:hypothetical protein
MKPDFLIHVSHYDTLVFIVSFLGNLTIYHLCGIATSAQRASRPGQFLIGVYAFHLKSV